MRCSATASRWEEALRGARSELLPALVECLGAHMTVVLDGVKPLSI